MVAQILAMQGNDVTFIGRLARKLELVQGVKHVLATEHTATELAEL